MQADSIGSCCGADLWARRGTSRVPLGTARDHPRPLWLCERHFANAEAVCRQVGAPYWLARNQLGHARMLHVRNTPEDTEHTRQLLEETLSISRRDGYKHLERQANRLLSNSF